VEKEGRWLCFGVFKKRGRIYRRGYLKLAMAAGGVRHSTVDPSIGDAQRWLTPARYRPVNLQKPLHLPEVAEPCRGDSCSVYPACPASVESRSRFVRNNHSDSFLASANSWTVYIRDHQERPKKASAASKNCAKLNPHLSIRTSITGASLMSFSDFYRSWPGSFCSMGLVFFIFDVFFIKILHDHCAVVSLFRNITTYAALQQMPLIIVT
jgi:hypothetical protein